MNERKEFDETAREALMLLFENFWILRAQDPESYQMIRDRENTLKDYLLDKLGYHLIIHRHFAKLEKIPELPEAWMGIETFQTPRDYGLLCCALAYIEGITGYEQFLLSDLCAEVQALYPGEIGLDWRNYEHRKSLVRVLQLMVGLGLLIIVDGETTLFNQNEGTEVLYEVSVVARYFLRTYPKDLTLFQTKEDILAAENGDHEDESTGVGKRHRVYRQLLLSPSMHREEAEEGDFLYLRNYRSRLAEDLEKHTGLRLEVYRHTALLCAPEPRSQLTLFPDQKGISDIVLQFASLTREQLAAQKWQTDPCGRIQLTQLEFEQAVKTCKEVNQKGWNKQYREGLPKATAQELLEVLLNWKFAKVDKESYQIYLLPSLGRLTGYYPQDFMKEGSE